VNLTCRCCGADVPPGHPAHRGLLINEKASLGALLLQARERLNEMQGRRRMKRPAAQQGSEQEIIQALEASISRAEKRLRDLAVAETKVVENG